MSIGYASQFVRYATDKIQIEARNLSKAAELARMRRIAKSIDYGSIAFGQGKFSSDV
jgi:hypothetical protein